MQVLEGNGHLVGRLEEIIVTGANDVYVVRQPDGKELLLPAIKDVVIEVDRESRRMFVTLQDWE
jgi:16S rRNA processing protein RimM